MNKKTYKQPSIKEIQLENTDIICTSPSTLSITDDYIDDSKQGDVPSEIYGRQW